MPLFRSGTANYWLFMLALKLHVDGGASSSSHGSEDYFERWEDGNRFDGEVLRSAVLGSAVACSALCCRTDRCGGVNVNRGNDGDVHCQLVAGVPRDRDLLRPDPHSKVYRRRFAEVSSTVASPHQACPVGWNLVNVTCIKISSSAVKQKNGQAECSEMGGALLAKATALESLAGVVSAAETMTEAQTFWVGEDESGGGGGEKKKKKDESSESASNGVGNMCPAVVVHPNGAPTDTTRVKCNKGQRYACEKPAE